MDLLDNSSKIFFLKKNIGYLELIQRVEIIDFRTLLRKKIRPDIIIHCAGSGIVGVKDISYRVHKKKFGLN